MTAAAVIILIAVAAMATRRLRAKTVQRNAEGQRLEAELAEHQADEARMRA